MGTMTDAIRAIWARYEAELTWAARCERRGDTFRAELSRRHAWATVERAFCHLGAQAQREHRAARKPELYLICGEHPVFRDPPPPANDVACVTCDDTQRLADGRPCQFCCRPAERPLIANDVEETTAIEGATLQLPALDPGLAALEADINRRWALQDGRIGDAFAAAQARIEAELARLARAKAVR